jgi:putative peptidoglycan lipid II flippase
LKDASANKVDAAGQAGASERQSVTAAARVLASLTLVSRVAGLARDIVISSVFGASMGADAFFVAFRIPNLFRRVVGEGATSAAFVPVFTSHLVKEGQAGAIRASGAVGGAAFLVLVAMTAIGMLASGPIVTVFAPGFTRDPAKAALAIDLTRWTFPYLLVVGAAAWAMGVLNTFRNFAVPAFGPVLLNLSIIGCALLLSTRCDPPVYALVAGVLIGGSAQFLVQVPSLGRLGLRPADLLRIAHPAVGRVGGLVGAAVLGGAVYQVNILVATVFASLLPSGSVSWLWYGDRVFEFPLGIVAVALGTAALPSLSSLAGQGRLEEMAESVSHALRLTLVLCLPAAVGLWVLSPDIVAVLFERGQFTPEDTAMTAWALRAYLPGIFGVAAVRVLASAFYALERPRIPVLAAVVALVANVVGDLALMGPIELDSGWSGVAFVARAGDLLRVADLRHAGLALSTGLAATVNAALLLLLLRRMLPPIGSRRLLRCGGLHLVASGVMLLVLLAVAAVLPTDSSVGLACAVAAGGLGYALACHGLGSEEFEELTGSLLRRFGRRSRKPGV